MKIIFISMNLSLPSVFNFGSILKVKSNHKSIAIRSNDEFGFNSNF